MPLTPTSSPEHFGRHNRIEAIRAHTVDGINGIFDVADVAGAAGATVLNRTAGFAKRFGNALFSNPH
ncbi:hypothetical protein HYZ99_05415 [Candidatus Peregrinibacteria bacterium]|nr:hypothetical protein [Candidatus Peregrinibacteria bacterium]